MEAQKLIEETVRIFEKIDLNIKQNIDDVFQFEYHIDFLQNFLETHYIYQFFDVQKPWLIYWGVNALSVFNKENELSEETKNALSCYILKFQCEQGGFSGSLGNEAHILPTYSAILALSILNRPEYIKMINKEKMYQFLMSLKCKNGSFQSSRLGEIDLRALYAALVVAELLNINSEELKKNCAEYLVKCQSFEGGMGPEPFVEAHGGYTFCGISSLCLLNSLHLIDIQKLKYWMVNKQQQYFGGFQGRTNKLVDSCYAFWQGSIFFVLQNYGENIQFDYDELQKYIVYCCQESEQGGLRDKPGKGIDIYHTMYALVGFSLTQQENRENKYFEWNQKTFRKYDPIFTIPVEYVLSMKEITKINQFKQIIFICKLDIGFLKKAIFLCIKNEINVSKEKILIFFHFQLYYHNKLHRVDFNYFHDMKKILNHVILFHLKANLINYLLLQKQFHQFILKQENNLICLEKQQKQYQQQQIQEIKLLV